MRRSFGRSFLSTAAMAGLVVGLCGSTAFAQPKGEKPAVPGKAAPGKAAPGEGAPAKQPAPPEKGPKAKPKTAAQKQEEAKTLFAEGKAKFDSGDYAGAYQAFKTADELVPDPPVPKYRMAEALDKQGDVEGAIKAYEAFLGAKPRADKDKERIDTANARIAALKVAPADVKVVLAPAEATAAALSLDGAPVTGNPVKVPPGKHTIGAKLEGFEDGKVEVEVVRGEKKEVSIALAAKAGAVAVAKPVDKPSDKTTPPPPPDTSSGSSVIPAAVTLSLAGAGVVVGAVFGGLALKSKGEFEDTPTQDLFDTTERNALIADMSFGVALTFGVTGLVLLLTDTGGSEEAPKDDKKPAEKKASFRFAPYGGPLGQAPSAS